MRNRIVYKQFITSKSNNTFYFTRKFLWQCWRRLRTISVSFHYILIAIIVDVFSFEFFSYGQYCSEVYLSTHSLDYLLERLVDWMWLFIEDQTVWFLIISLPTPSFDILSMAYKGRLFWSVAAHCWHWCDVDRCSASRELRFN